ncbi:MAG TPA: ComEC/Rec2 family competence protein [Candidatus Limnocylindria bacterium]|nr:ComEC/Rec2 family competence protein [Candidatus Limnocylindria bacterium]
MSAATRIPLLPAAIAACAAALVPLAGAAAALVAVALAGIALGRRRRLAWTAAAVAAAVTAARHALAPPGVDDVLGPARAELVRSLAALVPAPESELAIAMLLGERSGIPRELADAFARTGTAHLLAISGFNMTLAAGSVASVLKRRARPAVVAAAALASVATYAALVGPQPSVLRAAVMASVAAVALGIGRTPMSANALAGAVALMVALDPSILGSLSFQLSVTATAGLIAFQPPLARRFAGLPGPIAEGLATTLAASALTVPLVAAAFGRVSLVAPLANLVAVPIFAPLLLFAAGASVVGAVDLDAARPLALATWALAAALGAVVGSAAAIPLAAVEIPRGALGTSVACALVGLAALLVRRRWDVPAFRDLAGRLRARPVPRLPRLPRPPRQALAAAMAVPLVLGAAFVLDTPDARLRALDVGQGDAYLLELGDAVVLIDGGPEPKRLVNRLGAAFPPWRRRIDAVVLTHAHLDHGAGLVDVFGRYDVGLAIEPRGMEGGSLTERWRAAAAAAGVPVRSLGAGDRLRLGDATLEVLAPNDDPRVELRCLVLRVTRGAFSALFTGDATDAALADLLLEPARLRAAIYVPPHHGAATPHAQALVEAVRPRVALLSVGASNRYGHPAPATLAALGRIPTYRTDRDGTVEVALDGTQLTVRGRTGALPPDRGGSVPRAPPAR